MKKTNLIIAIFLAFSIASCQTDSSNRLQNTRPVRDLRIDDIVRMVDDDPLHAIHLIEVYMIIYGPGTAYPESPENMQAISQLRDRALENIQAEQIRAVEEEQWRQAASLARSLGRLGHVVESTGDEPDIVLEYAKLELSRNNVLNAFLAAAEANSIRLLDTEDAMLFLEKAVEVRQRRSAAFFLEIIDSQGAYFSVPPQYRSYAEGRDTASDMIKGVATVIVDRGIRIERGQGIPDRVLGSAFFIDDSGLLITNYHVIESEVDPSFRGTSRIFIRMGDHTSLRIPARVIGWDKTLDLALIKAEIVPEYVYSVIDWAMPMVGETILAIGSPGGLERTVTQGIVSALGRRFLQIGDVIQIDAAINNGNSGGPVLNMDGRLIGVVFAGIQNYEGLNFAVPAYRLFAALPALLAGGRAERPWLGLALSETTEGAEIIYVAPFTPAAEQQIREGSIIRSINGYMPSSTQGTLITALQDELFSLIPGELVVLELLDPDYRLITHTIRMTSRPDLPLGEAAKIDTRERMAAPLFGLVLSDRAVRGFTPSFQVRRVIRGSIADEAGISEDDQLSIRNFRIFESDGYALLEVDVRKRRMGFLEVNMRLPALLDTPDTL